MAKLFKIFSAAAVIAAGLWTVGSAQGVIRKQDMTVETPPASTTGGHCPPAGEAGDVSTAVAVKENFRLQGKLDKAINGTYDLNLSIYKDETYSEFLTELALPQVEFVDGSYSVLLNPFVLGLVRGNEYWVKIEAPGSDLPVQEVKLEIVPKHTIQIDGEGEDRGTIAGGQIYEGTFSDFFIKVINHGTGYAIWAISDKGTAIYAQTGAAGKYAVHAENPLGTALFVDGKAKIQGDLELTGNFLWSSFNLPANSVGTSQITNGSILDADISPTASIAASKINRTGLDADLLDGLNSTAFLKNTGDIKTSGNLKIDGTGYSYILGSLGVGTTGPVRLLHTQGPGPQYIRVETTENNQTGIELMRAGYDWRLRDEGGPLYFDTGDGGIFNNTVVFGNLGGVSIGTGTPPSEKLEVNGNIKIAGAGNKLIFADGSVQDKAATAKGYALDAKDGNPIDVVYVDDAGKVGVGTITPTEQLEVAGNIKIAGTGHGIQFPDGTNITTTVGLGSDNLGNHTAVQNIQLNGNWLSAAGANDGVFVSAAGNTGIGTAAPAQKLSVAGVIESTTGGIKFPDGTIQDTKAVADNLGNHTATKNINLSSNWLSGDGENEGVFVTSSGAVGIGTISPGTLLEVFKAPAETPGDYLNQLLRINEGIGTADKIYSFLSLYDGSAYGADVGLQYNNLSGYKLSFSVNDDTSGYPVERIRIVGNSGNVGIGTTSPAEKLEVSGNIKIAGTGHGIQFPDGTNITTTVGLGLDNLGNHTAVQNIQLNGNWLSAAGANDGVFVSAAGNTGIGTAAPAQKLSVAGVIESTTGGIKFPDGTIQDTKAVADNLGNHTATKNINLSSNWLSGDGENEGVFVTSSGAVGIGTISPGTLLEVFTAPAETPGDYLNQLLRINQGIGTTDKIYSFLSLYDGSTYGADVGLQYNNLSGYKLSFSVNDDTSGYPVERIRIVGNSGNVGIGTTSPAEKLEVSGNIKIAGEGNKLIFADGSIQDKAATGRSNALDAADGDPVDAVYVDDAGKVGVGTITPTEQLEVAGNIKIAGTGNGIQFPDGTNITTTVGLGLDNLGNHTAVQNIQLNGNWLSAAGANDGVFVSAAGNTGIGTAAPAQKLSVAGVIESTTGGIKFPDGTIQDTKAIVDNLGDHTATKNINLSSNWLSGDGENEGVFVTSSGAVGIGTSAPAQKLHVAGIVRTDELEIVGGSDLAEPFAVNSVEEIVAGMVVSIDPENPGKLRLSNTTYDRTVAGIVSGAGGIKAGLTMRQSQTLADGNFPVALTGRVYCWADASSGAIQPGDLLTTSSTPGHAMKVTDFDHAHGAILGKAMTGLKEGKGLVLVLVSLQ